MWISICLEYNFQATVIKILPLFELDWNLNKQNQLCFCFCASSSLLSIGDSFGRTPVEKTIVIIIIVVIIIITIIIIIIIITSDFN